MFNKLKHIKDLRNQAKSIQSKLADESITVEKGGVKIVMNGNMILESVTLNENLAKDSLEGILVDSINDAIKKAQKIMAQKMQELGGLPGLN